MKKIIQGISLIVALSLTNLITAQAPNWQWAIGAGGVGSDESGSSITSDASGNVYSIGTFGCNTLTIGSKTVTRAGGGNPYVVKQDASGNVLWAKSYSFSPPTLFGIGQGKSIFADASGNVYIAGYYFTSIVIGTNTLLATDSTSGTTGDVFIAKLDASGNVLWAKSAGGAHADNVDAITADASGNVYITGIYTSRYMRFGSGITLFNPNNSSSNSFGNTDIYVAKYNSSGTPQWARNTASPGGGFNEGKSITTDAAGNVLVAGTFYLSSIAFGTNTLTGTAAINMFVTKYDNNGNVIWAKTAASAGTGSINHTATGITTDASNNVYITGANGASTLTIGSVVLANSSGAYVAKLDASGTCQWAKPIVGNAVGTGIAHNSTGDIYVTGYFDGMSCAFGTTTLTNSNTSGNNTDIYVAKYSSSGSFTWATSAGGIYEDLTAGITVDGSDNAYVTGYTKSTTMAFGSLNVAASNGYQDIIIAKIGNATGIKENNEFSEIHVYPNPSNGKIYVKQDPFSDLNGVDLILTNTLGQVIYSKSINSLETEIDLSTQPKGIYFVRLEKEGKTATCKFIIE
jgi:hypothetical protein